MIIKIKLIVTSPTRYACWTYCSIVLHFLTLAETWRRLWGDGNCRMTFF